MSYPHEPSGHQSRRSTTSAPVGSDHQYRRPLYSSQSYDQQSGMQVDSYGTPQDSTSRYSSRTTSHQRLTQHSSGYLSQSESLCSPSGSHLSNNTADTTLSSQDAPFDYGNAQQAPYVRGTTCSTDSYESHQQAPGRERQDSVRSSVCLPPPGRQPGQGGGHHGGHHGSNGRPGGSGTRRQRDGDSSVFDDDEELSLEGHRYPLILQDLPPTDQRTHRRRYTDTLAGIGGHLEEGRSYQSGTRVRDIDPMIYGSSTVDGRGYPTTEFMSHSPELSPSSLTSSMASLAVHNGSAQG